MNKAMITHDKFEVKMKGFEDKLSNPFEERNYSLVSRIIAEGIKAGMIKDSDPESNSKKHAKYIPFWG